LEGKRELPVFHYFNKGDMAVIGRAAAVANIFGFHISGLPAWLIWLFVASLHCGISKPRDCFSFNIMTRMRLGPDLVVSDWSAQFAIADPSLG
jgi:NADH dehydrogenase FAD-containing subunit